MRLTATKSSFMLLVNLCISYYAKSNVCCEKGFLLEHPYTCQPLPRIKKSHYWLCNLMTVAKPGISYFVSLTVFFLVHSH